MTEPIGLSTSWNGPGRDAETLLDQHRGLGFQRLEAYAHFTLDELRRLAAAARQRGMQIASLHSPCPVPTNAQGERLRWTDGLASVDHSERAFAVETIKRSIDAAAEIGALAIVVHLGNTGVASRQGSVFEAVARTGRLSDEHRRLRDEVGSNARRPKDHISRQRCAASASSANTRLHQASASASSAATDITRSRAWTSTRTFSPPRPACPSATGMTLATAPSSNTAGSSSTRRI